MFVKVVPLDGESSIFQPPAGSPVQFGRHVLESNPADVEDWNDELGVAFSFLYARGDWGPAHTYQEIGEGEPTAFWTLAYAWWSDPNEGEVGVITAGRIFILGEDGKTIDRA